MTKKSKWYLKFTIHILVFGIVWKIINAHNYGQWIGVEKA